MSEWNHSPSAGKPGRKQKSGLIFAGAAAALLAAGVIFQFVRAQPTQAEVQKQPKAGAAPAASPQRAQHLARVGEDLISYDQVAAECVARVGEKVLDDLINRTIIQQACQKRGVVVTAEEVDAEVKRIADEFNLPVDTYLQMIQSEREVAPGTFRRDFVWPKLALQKLAGEEITVTEDDMRIAFERDYGPKVKARWIMLDNQRRATEIWEQVRKNPDEFEKLAQEFSTDANSRPMGGQIPPISRHMVGYKTLEDAAFKLKEGDISGVIQLGPSQYVILLCEGQTEQIVEIDEVKDYLHDQIVKQKTMEAAGLVLKDLKDTTVVHNFLTNTTSGGDIVPVSATESPSREHASAAKPKTAFSPAGPTVPSPKKSAKATK